VSTAAVSKRMDALLGPLGFERKKRTWTRTSGDLLEVVDDQTSKSGEKVTVNAGVLDPEVFTLCWDEDPPSPPDETACTVRARVGQLLPGEKDVWWPCDEDDTPEQVADALSETVIPFLESMHTREAMIGWLTDRGVTRQQYPPPVIYLAILHHLAGDDDRACALLGELGQKSIGDWGDRVGELSARFDCS